MNIEKTISEQAVSDILTPMLESQDRIVTEDVAPLFDEATGLDTPPASGTVTTTIEESRSVISAIIRKAWTAPLTMLFGASVIGYIAAAYTYLRNRLQGNETYGIPDRRSEISASSPLAANLALLNDRKIGGVNAEVPDGLPLARILTDTTAAAVVTELSDDTHGWTLNKSLPSSSTYKKVSLNCKAVTTDIISSNTVLEELNIPELETIPDIGFLNDNTKLKHIYGPKIKNMTGFQKRYMCGLSACEYIDLPEWTGASLHVVDYFCNNPSLKLLNIPSCASLRNIRGLGKGFCLNNPLLERVVLGKLSEFSYSYGIETGDLFYNCPNLIRIEIGEGTAISFALVDWSPTLDSSNLQQFLSNFKTYIANRLKGFPIGQGPTLTLSQAVYDAIKGTNGGYASTHTLGEICGESLVLTPLEIELGITENTLYSTWLTTYFGENGINWNIETPN